MSINQQLNKQNFINEQLDWWANHVTSRVVASLVRKNIGVTQELLNSIKSRARKETSELLFNDTGRFVDMGAGRGYHKGVESLASNRSVILGYRESKRKPKKFYSKTAYGTLNPLINRLVNTYDDAIIYGLKNQLEKI